MPFGNDGPAWTPPSPPSRRPRARLASLPRQRPYRTPRASRTSPAHQKYFPLVLHQDLSWFICLQLFQEHFFLPVGGYFVGRTFARRIAVPAVVSLDGCHSFTRCRVSEYHRGFFLDRARFVARIDELADVVSVHFDNVTVEGAIFIGQGLERHHVLRITVYLYVVAIHYGREVRESVLRCEHRAFPCVAFLVLAVGGGTNNPELLVVHPCRVGI